MFKRVSCGNTGVSGEQQRAAMGAGVKGIEGWIWDDFIHSGNFQLSLDDRHCPLSDGGWQLRAG